MSRGNRLREAKMSVIHWTNRGDDDFDKFYGAHASTARNLVDLAIAHWAFVIQNFNYSDTTHPNEFEVAVSAGHVSGFGGDGTGQVTNVKSDADGKPFEATVTMDDHAQGGVEGPWFFADVAISDFPDPKNEYRGESTEIGGLDFFTSVLHELGHAVGFAFPFPVNSALRDHLTPVDEDNPNTEIKALQNFQTNTTTATFSGGHLWTGTNPVVPPPLAAFPHDDVLMNPGSEHTKNERTMISPLEAMILRDAFGYTICEIEQVPKLKKSPLFWTQFCDYYMRIKPPLGCGIQPVIHGPVLDEIGDIEATEGEVISFRVQARGASPGQKFVCSLEPGAPDGATIHPNTGDFRWSLCDDPPVASITLVGVRVTAGEKSDSKLFSVTVS